VQNDHRLTHHPPLRLGQGSQGPQAGAEAEGEVNESGVKNKGKPMIDQNDPDKTFKSPMAWAKALYPLVGVIAGVVCMIDGATLFFSAIDLPAYQNGRGADPLLLCLPGAALFAVGLLLVFMTWAKAG
jgi:hypothetical protein